MHEPPSTPLSSISADSAVSVFPRAAEKITLLDEELLNRRPIGGPGASLDRAETYVTRQEAYLAQRFANLIEFQTAAMIRGTYSYASDGDLLRHGFTGGDTTVTFPKRVVTVMPSPKYCPC